MEARSVGYAPHAWYVTTRANGAVRAELVLSRVTVLNGVEVVAAPDTTRLDVTGFTQRRKTSSGGIYIDQARIDALAPSKFTDVLRSLPGVDMRRAYDGANRAILVPVLRGDAQATEALCPVQYYLDGRPFDLATGDDIDYNISPREIGSVEVYTGASQVPPQFKGPRSRCGVIVIWTRAAMSGN